MSNLDNYITPSTITIPKTEYRYLGTWGNSGKPNYLIQNDKDINLDLIKRLVNSLPEGANEVQRSPGYYMNPTPRSVLISSTKSNFAGADVYVSFVYEGAGYNNVLGYYVFPIVGGRNYPTTTDSNGNIIPINYNYLVDPSVTPAERVRRRKLLNKTIVFPNTSGKSGDLSSLPPSYVSAYYGGGLLSYGNTVQIFYDPTDKTKKFPNNTGIGFFVIPNGWTGNTINDTTFEHIHTDNILNPKPTNKNFKDANKILPCDSTGFVQTILFVDSLSTTDTEGNMIISFEDIMRNGGDRDTNDCVIKVKYTPYYSVNITGALRLSNDVRLTNNIINTINLNDTSIIVDKSGLYITIPVSSVQYFASLIHSPFNTVKKYRFDYTFEFGNYGTYIRLKSVFFKLVWEYGGYVVSYDDGTNKITIRQEIDKHLVQSVTYLMDPIKNRNVCMRDGTNETVLYAFQSAMINDRLAIKSITYSVGYYTMTDPTVSVPYQTVPLTLTNSTLALFSMGDPILRTLSGKLLKIPDITGEFLLIETEMIKIHGLFDHYEPNNGTEIDKLTYTKKIFISTKLFVGADSEYLSERHEINLFELNEYVPNGPITEIPMDSSMKESRKEIYGDYDNIIRRFRISSCQETMTIECVFINKKPVNDAVSSFMILNGSYLFAIGGLLVD